LNTREHTTRPEEELILEEVIAKMGLEMLCVDEEVEGEDHLP
jgi:hypothetical protein